MKGVNREASQAALHKFLAAGCHDLTVLSGSHQLTMWLCLHLFEDFVDFQQTSELTAASSTDSSKSGLSPAEEDIAHYIGGFVCCKLKQRSSDDSYKDVVRALVSSDEPAKCTLLAAKSRGGLLHLTQDAKCVFVQFEEVFRLVFPPSSVKLDVGKYAKACLDNEVVQNCFHSLTSSLDSAMKDKVFCDIISLYFKVRVHRQCKNIVEQVHCKKHDSKKAKALRSKLAK